MFFKDYYTYSKSSKRSNNLTLIELRDEILELNDELHTIKKQKEEEAQTRAQNPGLQELYEQYQTMFNLVRKKDNFDEFTYIK